MYGYVCMYYFLWWNEFIIRPCTEMNLVFDIILKYYLKICLVCRVLWRVKYKTFPLLSISLSPNLFYFSIALVYLLCIINNWRIIKKNNDTNGLDCGVLSLCRLFLNQLETCVNVRPVLFASALFSSGVGYLFLK